jgi:hypothetical protein
MTLSEALPRCAERIRTLPAEHPDFESGLGVGVCPKKITGLWAQEH